MVKISFRQKANEDLNSIWNYTYENWSENQADKYYATIKFDCLEIGKNPKLGKIYNGISRNLLGLKSGKHIIFYHSISEKVSDNYYENQDKKIKRLSKTEWPNDFEMQLDYIQRQRNAIEKLKNHNPIDISKEDFQNIRNNGRSEWPDDFEMQLDF